MFGFIVGVLMKIRDYIFGSDDRDSEMNTVIEPAKNGEDVYACLPDSGEK
jgi:hypothetical protein